MVYTCLRRILLLIIILCFMGKTPGVVARGKWTNHGGSCYYISTSTVGYASQGAIECSKLGGYLVEVETMEEHYNLITDLNQGDEYWVGLEMNANGDLVWIINGTEPVVPYVVSNGHSTARYKYLAGGGWKFDDYAGPYQIRYICEKQKTYFINVTCDGSNKVAVDLYNKPTLQSTNKDNINYISPMATDYSTSTCAITSVESNPWWQIDLLQPMVIKDVMVQFGTQPVLGPLQTFIIKTFVNDPTMLHQSNVAFTCGTIEADWHTVSVLFECVPHTIGRYLRILKLTTDDALSLCDVTINAYTCTETKLEDFCSIDTKGHRYRFSYEPPITPVPISPSPCYNMPYNTPHSTPYNTPEESSTVVAISSTSVLQMSSYSETVQSSFYSFDDIETSSSSATGYSSVDTPVHVSMSSVQTFEQMIAKLRVDNKATSSYRRKLISAEDDRITSQYIGYIGIIILVVYLVMLLIIDINRFYYFIRNTVRQR